MLVLDRSEEPLPWRDPVAAPVGASLALRSRKQVAEVATTLLEDTVPAVAPVLDNRHRRVRHRPRPVSPGKAVEAEPRMPRRRRELERLVAPPLAVGAEAPRSLARRPARVGRVGTDLSM